MWAGDLQAAAPPFLIKSYRTKDKYLTITKMKKALIAMIFAVATLHGNAQNMVGTFLPRANDEVTLQHGINRQDTFERQNPMIR